MRDDILLVEDRPDLVRDKHSKAVKNTNVSALQAYKKKRAMRKVQETLPSRMEELEKKLDSIEAKLDRLLGD